MKEKATILEGNLSQIIWMIALPIVLTNMIDGLYGIIDSLFVANISSMAVASVAFVGSIQDTLNAVGTGLSIAGCSLVARFLGGRDEEKARRMIGHVAVIGAGVGLFIGLFSFFFADFILIQSGITETIMADASIYLRLTSWGVLCNFITILYLAIERAQGNTSKTIKINLCSISLKVVFCYILTVWQDFGIVGIGCATVLAQGICALISVVSICSKKCQRPLRLRDCRLEGKMSVNLIVTALPLVVEKALVAYGFVIVNQYVLAFGEPVLAAYGLTNKVNSVFFKAVTALGTGLAVIVAQNLGAGNTKRGKEAIGKTLLYGMGMSLVFLAFLIPLRGQIAAMFVDVTDDTYFHMVTAMGIYTASILPWGITEGVLGIFQGTGNTKYNLIISLVRIYAIRLPVVIVFSQPFWGLGSSGIWYAMLVSNSLSAVFSFCLYMWTKNKVMVVKS